MGQSANLMRRRVVLACGLAAGAAMLSPVVSDSSPPRILPAGEAGGKGGASVPDLTVSLADFGGRPGAGRQALVEAFRQGFAALTQAGGGTLLVPAGNYDFGDCADADSVILCRDLRDIAISAYGAVFTARTTTRTAPHLFYFFNFNNVTLAGASFSDPGFVPWIDWKGMYCVGIQADKPSSGFRMVDCFADHVLGLLASNNNAQGRQYMADIRVSGEVRNAYYGIGASNIREQVELDLDCHNIRRAFIAYALKNATITVRASNTRAWPGSNGLVALVCAGARRGNVENVRVAMDVSGSGIHSSYVHFYHQGPERDGVMRDIDATVNLIDVEPVRSIFLFDHETDGVQPRTTRSWQNISLHGSAAGAFTGQVVSNPSVPAGPATIHLDSRLAELDRGNKHTR
jgi:hypothetical protein